MYGIKVPKNVTQALKFDKENGNTLWQDAINKEMEALLKLNVQTVRAKRRERLTPLTLFLNHRGILRDIPVWIKRKRFWMRGQITGCL